MSKDVLDYQNLIVLTENPINKLEKRMPKLTPFEIEFVEASTFFEYLKKFVVNFSLKLTY